MARALLVVPTMAGTGLARTCLGLVRALDRRGVNVAFVKPVAQPRADGGPDRSIALAAATTALRPPDPLSTADLEQQLGSSGLDAVLEKVAAAWQPVHDRSDVVVVEGLSPGSARLYASGLNQALAKAIDADVLLVASWPAAGVGTGEDLADRAAELKLGPLPRRAQRDRLAALLLTAGTEPDPRVWELTQAACATGLPILVADGDSYETATRVHALDPGLPIDDLERIEGMVDSIAPRGCNCPTASPWSTTGPSPSVTSPRWPSCGGTRAGPRRWPAITSPTRSWPAP
jgi:BioD-like phosphotransacetylase family protein